MSRQASPAAWKKATDALACPAVGKPSLDCVRGKPWLDVLNAIRGGPSLAGGAMRFVEYPCYLLDDAYHFQVLSDRQLTMKSFSETLRLARKVASSLKWYVYTIS
jgi:hypothetical protein